MAQKNERKGRHFVQIAANGIIWIAIFISGIYLFTHLGDNAQVGNEKKSDIEIEGQAGEFEESPEGAAADAAAEKADVYDYAGYLDIYLQMENGLDRQDIKLYMNGNECYFYLPACAASDRLTIHYDESEYALSIDDKEMENGDRLSGWNVERAHTLHISHLSGVADEAQMDDIAYSLQFMRSESLPTVFIETANGTMEYLNESKEHKEPGKMVCILADGKIDSVGDLSIHARGQSSLEAMKKSYKITLEAAADFLSLGTATDWVLQANAFDPVRIRNGMAYQLARDFGLPYAVDSTYVDVYFNGEYGGNYLVCEQIEVEKNRVDIAGEKSYLFAVDVVSAENDSFTDQYGLAYDIRYPKENSEESLAWLAERMNMIENLISECDTREEYRTLQEYLDIDSFVIMYLIDEITNEEDINVRSTFYYIDEKNGKLCAGPAWDFDWSWGNKSEKDAYLNFNLYRDGMPEHLSKIPYFQQDVQAKLEDSMEILAEQDKKADVMAESVKTSVNMENIIYGSMTRACIDAGSFDTNIAYLKWYMNGRIALVTDFVRNPDVYHKVHIEDERTGRVYWVKDGETIPESVIRGICTHYGWADLSFESGTAFWEGYPILADLVLYPIEGNQVEETVNETVETEADKAAADRNTGNMEDISMGILIFIILLAPGFIALLISQGGRLEKDGRMALWFIPYICFDFFILLLVYGSLYAIKGSITLNLAGIGAQEGEYSFRNINVTFVFMALEVIWACVLGYGIRILRKIKEIKNTRNHTTDAK
ncbi:MAG: CotH kinase family protein [Bacillus sp. (in: Bacteria)]|nr:CotH kinase family protein [Bacillus sp. (in: firmicutes)]MCM1426051.1 CotH kinase family protein [Eubacterium sp.]